MGDELLTHRGYTIEIDQGPDGWSYAVSYGMASLGKFLAHTQEYARSEAMQLIDAHISKLASQGNGKAATERLGEMQITLNALYRQIARLEQRIRDLEAKALDTDRRMTGSIQGLEGEWTVTPPPYWADLFDSEGKPLDPGKKYHLVDTGETVVLEA